MVLTLSGGHRNTYGWQAGGTHPTEMLSCFIITAPNKVSEGYVFAGVCLSTGEGACMAVGMCVLHTHPLPCMPLTAHAPCHARPPRHAVNERAVRILLECILV